MSPRRVRRSPRRGLALGLAALALVAGLLAASPRHRAFYTRLFGRAPAVRPPAGAPVPRREPRSPAERWPSGFATPISPPTSPPAEAPAPGSPRPALAAVPRGGPGDQVAVPIVDEVPDRLPQAGVPPAWDLKEFSGRAEVDVVNEDGRVALRLGSERSSYALYRDVVVDPQEFPVLTWAWKVTRLPAGGDIRERARDDQAAQVYVIFPRWPFPRIHSDVLGYIWDSRAPAGLRLTSTQSANVKLVVLESGPERLGQWVSEERDVYQDYLALFGRDPPRIGKIAVMIDSNDTGSRAEALVGELTFRRAAPGSPGPARPPGGS